jgi:salicylate biosynthesis isochorismate synthase
VLFSHSTIAELARRLGRDSSQLRTASVPVNCDPVAVLAAGSALFARSTYFRTPLGDAVASLGVARHFSAAGDGRFGKLEQDLVGLPDLAEGTRLMLGFSFRPHGPSQPEWAGFGASDLILPSISLTRTDGADMLAIAVAPGIEAGPILDVLSKLRQVDVPEPPDPGVHTVESVPSTGDWQSEVAEAVGAIREGSFQKVVLARSVLVHSQRPTDPYTLVHHLGLANPSSYIFATVVGQAAFVGASPELLWSQQGREFQINPLAGSARRGKGEDDVAVGRQLLESPKDRTEHAIVVDDLVSRLGRLASNLDYPKEPSLRRMATVQHLSTEISGSLRDGVSPFDVLRSIHPTPAVGGTPRADALTFIDKVEGIDRGWYSGGVGWVDTSGGARVALALRCALVNGTESRLFAGNGIVADSDPAEELVETRLKFQPLINLLAAT